MYIVKKKDPWGSWVDMLHACHGHIAFNYYTMLKGREGDGNVILVKSERVKSEKYKFANR